MATVTKGIDFIVNVNTGTEASPTWTPVAGQRGASLTLNADTIDITSKDSNNWKEVVAGQKNWSIKFDSLVIMNDTGDGYDTSLEALESAYMSGNTVMAQIKTPMTSGSAVTYTGSAVITDLSYDYAQDKEATFSGTLQGTGAIVKASS